MTSMRGRGRGGGARGGGAVGDSFRRGQWRGGPPGSAGYSRGGGPGGNAAAGAQGTPYVPGAAGAAGARRMSNSGGGAPRKDDKSGKGFQTDTDISSGARGSERELKPWTPDAPENGPNGAASNGASQRDRDTLTFGGPISNVPWDQFETNERLFGAKTDYDENFYTTPLDRSGASYKKRERDADRLAAEIMAKPTSNTHIAEERGQTTAGDTKDEEAKYSGVVRNPNAYVPPGARKAAAAGLPPRKDSGKKDEPKADAKPEESKPAAADAPKETSTPLVASKSNGPTDVKSVTPPPQGQRSSADPAVDPAIASLGPGPAPTMTRSTSSVPQQGGGSGIAGADGSKPPAPLAVPPIGAVVDQARQFVETERERVAQRKQSMAKNERAHVLAEFKQWQAKFKVPLPIPKDILPILTKDEEKQKAIESKLERERLEAGTRKDSAKSPGAVSNKELSPAGSSSSKQTLPKKIPMKIPEIPPFRKKVPPAVPVPESASQNIALVTSPTPSNASITSNARLNPNASAFVFKPNANAPAFKPGSSAGAGGDSSAVTSPASQPAKLPAAPSTPSTAPKNPFYPNGPPKRIAVNMRDDFNPFKHGQVPQASSVAPQWPYTGRRSSVAFGGPPMHPGMPQPPYDGEDPSSPHAGPPQMLPGMPQPGSLQYNHLRYGPGIPPQMQPGMAGMMFPGHQFMPPQMSSPGQHVGPQHQGPNGMHMYFANGVPPNAHFVPPQMHFHPNGPGRPGPPGQMYYPVQGMPGGPQAPQMQPQMSFTGQPTPPQPHFQQPLPAQQGPPAPSGQGAPGYEGSPAP